MSAATAIRVHRLAELMPAMTPEEFAELKADIDANGLNEPIVLFEEQILDGRHRYQACQDLRVEPRFRAFDGESPAAFVLSTNVKRRHLTAAQRAMVGLAFLPEFEREAADRRSAGLRQGASPAVQESPCVPYGHTRDDGPKHRAAADAGAQVGVAGRTIGRAKRIKAAAPELAEKVKSGEMSIRKAESLVKAAAPQAKPKTPNGVSNGARAKPDYSNHDGPVEGRTLQVALANRRRVETIVGTCQAWDAALNDIHVELACRTATADEVAGWRECTTAALRALRKFDQRLAMPIQREEQ